MKTLAMGLADGDGVRVHPLTAEHATPALSLAPDVRVIDFVPGNLVSSGVHSIEKKEENRDE